MRKIKNSEKNLLGTIKALQEKVDYYENIMTLLPGHIYWLDKDNVFLRCNGEQATDAGLSSSSEIINKTNFDLPWRAQAKKLNQINLDVMSTGIVKVAIEQATLTDGDEKVYLSKKVPMRNKKNEIIGILGVSSDITELTKMQQELMNAKKKADVANDAKSEFIANISHDIRTPITGILGLTQELVFLASETLSTLRQLPTTTEHGVIEPHINVAQQLAERVEEDGELLLGATNELLHFLNDILETISLESGQKVEKVESFTLQQLIEHNIELMLPIARHKKIKLLYDISDHAPTVCLGLHNYLDRIIVNLLSNALKFTQQGVVKLQLHVLGDKKIYTVGETVLVNLIVEDTGIGIPEDKFDTIFEHFSRLTPAYQGIYKGAGLGLYTVKRYVEAMQATIKVESQLHQGTRFTVSLPLIVSDKLPDDKSPTSSTITKPCPTPRSYTTNKESIALNNNRQLRILIVEDNPIAARALSSMIKRFYPTCCLDCAQDGRQALAMAQANHYQLILMDIGLPDIDGINITKQLRAINNITPIVALTGHVNDTEKRQQALDAGMQEVLAKPLTQALLALLMQQFIDKKLITS